MSTSKLFYLISFFALAMSSCNKVEYHPYDGRIKGKTGLNAKNISIIEKTYTSRDTVTFAVISDTQRWYEETAKIVASINARPDIDFTLHLGDLTDFGVTKEFEWMRDCLEKLKKPYVCLIGNHDCLGTGEHVFKKIYGKVNIAFTAGRTRFVCLNTNSREYDHTTAVPDFGFIESEIKSFPLQAVNTVVAMHARPTSEQFDNNIKDIFEREILGFPNLLFCINGHDHHARIDDLFGDGNLYYGVTCAQKLNYYVFTVYPGGYSHESVDC